MDISYFHTELAYFLSGDLNERGKYEKTSETGSIKSLICLSFMQNLKIENAYVEIQRAIYTLVRNEVSCVTQQLMTDVSS